MISYSKIKVQNILLFGLIILFIISSCDQLGLNRDKIRTKDGWKEYVISEGDSMVINYNIHGKKVSESMFMNGYFHGKSYVYYDNGQIQYEINYSEGHKDGNVKWFFENGVIYRETEYIMGSREGIQKKYYKNGSLLAEIPYKDDHVQTGLKEYKKDGTLNHNLPKIRIKEIDKTVFENKIILEISTQPKGSKTKYSTVKYIAGEEHNISLKSKTKNGKAYIEYIIGPGDIRMEKVKLRVSTKTKLGNPLVLYKTYNLVAENKMK